MLLSVLQTERVATVVHRVKTKQKLTEFPLPLRGASDKLFDLSRGTLLNAPSQGLR